LNLERDKTDCWMLWHKMTRIKNLLLCSVINYLSLKHEKNWIAETANQTKQKNLRRKKCFVEKNVSSKKNIFRRKQSVFFSSWFQMQRYYTLFKSTTTFGIRDNVDYYKLITSNWEDINFTKNSQTWILDYTAWTAFVKYEQLTIYNVCIEKILEYKLHLGKCTQYSFYASKYCTYQQCIRTCWRYFFNFLQSRFCIHISRGTITKMHSPQ
jgi:hypothetical protein